MKRILFAASAAILMSAPANAHNINTDGLMEVYKHLHANPELSLMETETASYLAEKLEAMGYDVTEGVGGTGVVAVMENGPGKTVMIRADMDGLPVEEKTGMAYASKAVGKDAEGKTWPIMHACGHDIHMTVHQGTAQYFADNTDKWSGTLVMILQPAEELGQGARNMIKDGLFERFPKPDYNLALHANSGMPSGMIGVTSGWALANVDSVDITVRGVGGHGAYPHTTKDPIVLAAQLVTGFQSIISREISPQAPAVITVGSIHGGTKHNVIGEDVKLQLTLRSYTDDVREKTIASIERMTKNMALAYGMPEDKLPIVKVKDEFTPAAYNNPELAARALKSMQDEIGTENAVSVDPVMGGEDFGQFGRTEDKIPGVIYWLGAADPAEILAAQKAGKSMPSLHSPFFKPLPEPAIATGVQTMTATALSLFND